MSLKRRNAIAWILLFAAAVCWAGSARYRTFYGGTSAAESATAAPTTIVSAETTFPLEASTETTNPEEVEDTASKADYTEISSTENRPDNTVNRKTGSKTISLVLGFTAVLLSGAAILGFRQKQPIFGPDGIGILSAILFWIRRAMENREYIYFWGSLQDYLLQLSNALTAFVMLLMLREFWGWICAKVPLSWCSAGRIAERCSTPQLQLLTLALGMLLPAVGMTLCLNALAYSLLPYLVPMAFLLFSGVLGIACLLRYGSSLNHFHRQLDNYRGGKPISVQNGAFAETEKKLLEMQAQHEEAIRTAVTSERFKVDLISNVSHDLRTPLTSILGYSELLQKETLSPEGQEQLSRLNQKAGYMRDLVESLFELTKVSSGVADSKKEKIDLIRLLEQTIGLFDDQLNTAGLVVRRHYPSNSMMVVTDGARMHQVFANLLTNAIKYALPGTRIHLEVAETVEHYRVRMVNTASYEMDFQPEEIVQRFARGDKARSTKGSGLGLAIAQTYTQSVGGSFRVAIDGDQFSAIVELPKS